jgi:hypothetical protein
MSVLVSSQARECRGFAEYCADRARLQPDPQLRKDYLEMQGRWLALARTMSSQSGLNFFRPPA